MFIKNLTAATALVSSAALAAPSRGNATSPPWPVNLIECGPEQLYRIIDKKGHPQKRPVPSMFHETIGCEDRPLRRRQADADQTPVDLNDDTMRVEYYEGLTGETPSNPPQFTELWDNALDGCNANQCTDVEVQVQKSIMAPIHDPRQVTMRISGNFPSGDASTQRDHFFELLREAFDRAVEWEDLGDGVAETGPAYLYARAGQDTEYAASWLSVEFDDDNDDSPCDGTIEIINGIGQLVPELDRFFGFASAVCDWFD